MGAIEGEVDSNQILKKACLDGTLSGVIRKVQGQGGDPECPSGEKQWVTLGPKYRLCGCHLGKSQWVGLLGGVQKAAPVCQPLLCQPSFSE